MTSYKTENMFLRQVQVQVCQMGCRGRRAICSTMKIAPQPKGTPFFCIPLHNMLAAGAPSFRNYSG